jgi:hypothetical protein
MTVGLTQTPKTVESAAPETRTFSFPVGNCEVQMHRSPALAAAAPLRSSRLQELGVAGREFQGSLAGVVGHPQIQIPSVYEMKFPKTGCKQVPLPVLEDRDNLSPDNLTPKSKHHC